MTPTFRWFLDSCDIVCMTIKAFKYHVFKNPKWSIFRSYVWWRGQSQILRHFSKRWDLPFEFISSDNFCSIRIWCPMPSSIYDELPIFGMVTGSLKVNPYKRRYKTLLLGWWVYPYENNGCLDQSTYDFFAKQYMVISSDSSDLFFGDTLSSPKTRQKV